MSDTPDAHEPPVLDEVEIDLAAFLPEGTVLAAAGGVEPSAAEAVTDESDDEPTDAVTDVAAPGPVAEAVRPAVDVAVLERVESELAAVDAALEAIDAGEPGRSALLLELLGEEPASA